MKYKYSEAKLWYANWNQRIPFEWYDKQEVGGYHYRFQLDKDADVFVFNDNQCIPVCDIIVLDKENREIDYDSICDCNDGRYQVNYRVPGESGYRVTFYNKDELFIEGDAFDLFE